MKNTTASSERISRLSDLDIVILSRKNAKLKDICIEVLLARHNLLLWNIVWKYRSYIETCKVTEEDLFGEARYGFIVAFYKFDPDKGVKFTTYCYYWILQKVKRHIEYHSSLIRIPVHVMDSIKDINKYGGVEEASENVDKSVYVLEKALKSSDVNVVSMEYINDLGYMQEWIKADLFDFSILEDLEKAVVFSYFGFYCEPMKKNEICRVYGLSNKNMASLLAGALDKLKLDYYEKHQDC